MKRLFATLLTVAMVLSLTVPALAATEEKIYTDKYGEWTYIENEDGTVTITKFIGDRKNITVPPTIDGRKITVIGAGCFMGMTTLYNIVLPDTILEIGDDAFFGCGKLMELYLPYGIKKIGDRAFKDCKSLISLFLPDSLKEIGEDIVQGCDNITVYANKDTYAAEYLVAHKDEIGSITIYDVKPAPAVYYEPAPARVPARPVIDGERITISFGKTINGRREYTLVLIDTDPDWDISKLDTNKFNIRFYVQSLIRYDGKTETELVDLNNYWYNEATGEYIFNSYVGCSWKTSDAGDNTLTGWHMYVYNDEDNFYRTILMALDPKLNLTEYFTLSDELGHSYNIGNITIREGKEEHRNYNADGNYDVYEKSDSNGYFLVSSDNYDSKTKFADILTANDSWTFGDSCFKSFIFKDFDGAKYEARKTVQGNNGDNHSYASIVYSYDGNGNLIKVYTDVDDNTFSAYFDKNEKATKIWLYDENSSLDYSAKYNDNGNLTNVNYHEDDKYTNANYYDNGQIKNLYASMYKDLGYDYTDINAKFYDNGVINYAYGSRYVKSDANYDDQSVRINLNKSGIITEGSQSVAKWDSDSKMYHSTAVSVNVDKTWSGESESHYTQYIGGEECRVDAKYEFEYSHDNSYDYTEKVMLADTVEDALNYNWYYYNEYLNDADERFDIVSYKTIDYNEHDYYSKSTDLNTNEVLSENSFKTKNETIRNYQFVADTGKFNGWEWYWNYGSEDKSIVTSYSVAEYHYDTNSGTWTKTVANVSPKSTWDMNSNTNIYVSGIENNDFKITTAETLENYNISTSVYTYDESQASGYDNWRRDLIIGPYENIIDGIRFYYDGIEYYTNKTWVYNEQTYSNDVQYEKLDSSLLEKVEGNLNKANEIAVGKSSIVTENGVWTQSAAKQEMLDIEKEILGVSEQLSESAVKLLDEVEEIKQETEEIVSEINDTIGTVDKAVETAENLYNEALQNIPNGVEIDKAIELPVEELLQEAIARDSTTENVEAIPEEAPAEAVVANEEITETAAETVTEEAA